MIVMKMMSCFCPVVQAVVEYVFLYHLNCNIGEMIHLQEKNPVTFKEMYLKVT